LVNKWDLLDADWHDYEQGLRRGLGEMRDVATIPISAATGMNCLEVFSKIEEIANALGQEIATAKLNRVIERALEKHHLPAHRGRPVRIYYVSQVATFPPTFILFTNYPMAVPVAYRRYLKKCLQEELGIKGVPVRIVCRKK
jgi:GTP-binding protein